MANENLRNSLNDVSSNLINMHVRNLMGKHNITRANNNLKKITAADKSKLQESVKNLQIQTEAFLEDTTNKNGDINADSSLQSIMQKLQQVSNRKK